MKKNKFIDIEMGKAIKKIGMYFAVFAIVFGVVSSIRNVGGTYALDDSKEEQEVNTYTVTFNYNGGTSKKGGYGSYTVNVKENETVA